MATTITYAFSFEVGHEVDSHPLYSYGQVFGLMLLSYSTIYYPLVNVMDLVHCLPYDFLKLQWMRLRCILVRDCLRHISSCKNFSKTLIRMIHDDHVLFFMDGMFWASLFFIVGGTFSGGLFFTLPWGGNNFAAQDQHILYTCHEGREGQHGVSYDAFQVQIFIPPSLSEIEVEGDFQELLYWEVAHFVWMIAWGWRIHMREMFLNIFQTPCLEWRPSSSILAVA